MNGITIKWQPFCRRAVRTCAVWQCNKCVACADEMPRRREGAQYTDAMACGGRATDCQYPSVAAPSAPSGSSKSATNFIFEKSQAILTAVKMQKKNARKFRKKNRLK